ncbi:MAG: glycosyltransferase family 2 protein [Spirochaetia bacterium]|nr:glycosyltransferase family 2 protein [Spirochaetia bacterium]
MSKNSLLYSVVIPVYKSENILSETVKATVQFFKKRRLNYEIILIDDNSPDKAWSIVKEFSKSDKNITGFKFIKNYGQHTAILCGFEHAKGDYIITMDDDMQNPPGEIINLINKTKEGYDLVFGKFKSKKHAFYRKLGTKFIGYLNNKIFQKPDNLTLSNFRIIHKSVIERLISYKTAYPYIPGLLLMFAANPANAEVMHMPRKEGKSNYGFVKIMQLVSRILFNYSTFPLKFMISIGFIIAFLSFAVSVFFIVRSFFTQAKVPGWTSIVVILSFFQGVSILILGMLGEYIGRLVMQQSKGKAYHIKDSVNLHG